MIIFIQLLFFIPVIIVNYYNKKYDDKKQLYKIPKIMLSLLIIAILITIGVFFYYTTSNCEGLSCLGFLLPMMVAYVLVYVGLNFFIETLLLVIYINKAVSKNKKYNLLKFSIIYILISTLVFFVAQFFLL